MEITNVKRSEKGGYTDTLILNEEQLGGHTVARLTVKTRNANWKNDHKGNIVLSCAQINCLIDELTSIRNTMMDEINAVYGSSNHG